MKRWFWMSLGSLGTLYHYGIRYGVLFTGLMIANGQLPGASYTLSANGFVTSIASLLWLRSARRQSRWIAASYCISLAGMSLWLSPTTASAVAATGCGITVFAMMAWLFRARQPLSEPAIDRQLLLQLISGYMAIALPIGLLVSGLFIWFHHGYYNYRELWVGWIYNSLDFLLILIPTLKISHQSFHELLSIKKGLILLSLVMLACGLSLAMASTTQSPFIFVAMFLALFALYHTPLMVSIWTLGSLLLSWFIVSQQWGWLSAPEFVFNMSTIEIWAASILTVFFLQLISFLTELMNDNARRLQHSEARMRGALEFAATGFALTSQQGEILEANACLCRMLGYSREELKGLTAFELSHPDDRLRSKINLDAIGRGDIDHYEFEKRYLCKNGDFIWVYVRLSLLNYSQLQPKELILQVDNITDRKLVEGELQHKENRLKLALAAANAGAWEWDLIELRSWWADEIYHILRLSPGDINPGQEAWLALIHPDDKPRVQACIQHAITHMLGYRETYRIIRQDGSTAWIEDYADVEVDGEGRVCRVYGISQDVTERTLIDLAVQHSESRLRAILECAVDAIITMDSMGRIHSFNPAAEKMFGYSAAETLGENITLIIPSPHKERHQSYIERYLKTGIPHIIGKGREMMAQHKSGRLIPIDLTITEVDNQGDRFFTGMLRDISVHKQAEADLIAARSELQGVINAASEISIIVTNREGLITLFNTGSERMLGYDASEIVGIRTPILFHDINEIISRGIEITRDTGKPAAGFATIITEAIRNGFDSREWCYIRKDGTKLTVLLTVTPIRDGDNKLTGFLGIAKDITPLKITQAELYRAKIQAESASKAKSEFLANMSHEIRTPLNAVLGTAYLLKDTKLDNQQQQYIKMIASSGRSLLYILNDILDFSKIEAGRMDISPAEFSLDEILESLASMMSVNSADKDLDLLMNVQPDVPRTLIGDGMRLQQILINLTGNAIKFTHQGSITLSITRLPHAESPLTLRFSILDTGIGMTPPQLERLFAPFTQADSSMTRQYGGTGLGLVISKRLVELMGGTLGVESQAGRGSEFWFCLPFDPAQSDAPPALHSLRVAILDSNPEIQAAHTLIVETLGWSAVTTIIDQDLATRLPKLPCDIALISWPPSPSKSMAIFAAAEQNPDTIWIAVSRLQDKETQREHPLTPRLAAILVQPLTSSNLYNAVQEALVRRSAHPGTGVEQQLQPVPAGTSLAGVLMLLVEDNEINQIVASRILEQEGAQVDVVNNGQEAVDRLRGSNPYDLILMDVQMPIMDGYTATRLLRQELGITTPILAMTAGVMSSEQEECRRCGMNDIIGKPLDVQQMLSCLQQYLHLDCRTASPIHPTVQPGSPVITLEFDLSALRRTLGDDERLMARLFRQFLQETSPFQAQFEQYQVAQDQQALARLLHTLKGHAGTFGAVQLASLCQQLENALTAGSCFDETALLSGLWRSLNSLHLAMTQWLSDYQGPLVDGSEQTDQAVQLQICRLAALLESRNLSALELFDELRGDLLHRSDLVAINELDLAMDALDFKRASQLLNPLMSSLCQPPVL